MENHVSQQLALLGLSALCGVAAAIVYDVLRAVRLRRRALTHALDALYGLALLAGLSVFTRRWGGGELRLFMVLGILGGAGIYFLLPAHWLAPLWAFWADTCRELVRILLLPVRFALDLLKKFFRRVKKDFLFAKKYAKIKRYKWEFLLIHRRSGERGGRFRGEERKKGQKKEQPHHRSGAGRVDRRAGR